MFPKPAKLSTLSSHKLLTPLLSPFALSALLYASTTTPQTMLAPTEVRPFLQDLATHFTDQVRVLLPHGILS
jgi:hypothetical protein